MILRDYQIEAVKQGSEILAIRKILIVNFEVRLGKTFIALELAKNYKNVLFITKKKAISSIEKDYATAGHSYPITIVNYESLHKINGYFDLVIADESHGLGAIGKPTLKTKRTREKVKNDLILLTGTLLPENNAQLYHQLWISQYSPFKKYVNFYKWHHQFGTKKIKYTSYGVSNDYSVVDYDKLEPFIRPIMITKTQKQGGFNTVINEKILTVNMQPRTYEIAEKLKKDLVIESRGEVIMGETGVKMMQKLHQIYSGSVILESGKAIILDFSKTAFIKEYFKDKKIAIFYKFKAELENLSSAFDITQDIEEFNNTDKNIALQIVSGREGINLSKAEAIVYFNIDFSATSYWQSRSRMDTIDRKESNIYWIFSSGGIEQNIYRTVLKKKSYTLQTFRRDCKTNSSLFSVGG